MNELKQVGRGAPSRTPSKGVVSIAVLPFANRSASADDEYFAEGLADELLGVLGRIRGLRVAARTSSARFRGEDPSTVGRALNVTTVLEGSVRKAADRVRISVQLVNVADGFQVWSETYDRMLDDIFAVQDDIAQSVVKELRTQLLGEADDSDASRGVKAEVARAVQGRTANPEAHRLLLQARHMIESRRDDQSDRAIGLLERALALDPEFASAYVTLSQIHAWKADFQSESREEERALARTMVERALELEPNLAEAHILSAWVTYALDLNWKAGWAAARRALELGPNDSRVLRIAGMIARSGRLPEGLELAQRSLEADPVSALAHHYAGQLMGILGRHEQAREYFRRALELAPDSVATRALDALSLLALGRLEEALGQAGREVDGAFRWWSQSVVLHALGRIEESDRELQLLIEKHPLAAAAQIAEAYARRGDTENAFAWIERGIESHDGGIMVTHCSRPFVPMRSDPRWTTLMRRMGYDD